MEKEKSKIFFPLPEELHLIGVPAPASLPDRKNFIHSLKLAESNAFKIRTGSFFTTEPPEKYFSGPLEARIRDLNEMIRCEEMDMILCARGGYGSAHLLPFLDWKAWKNRKRPLLLGGYSDITSLHLAMMAQNIPGGAACPMFAHLAEVAANRTMALSMKKTLSAALRLYPLLSEVSPEGKNPDLFTCGGSFEGLCWKKFWKMRSFSAGRTFPAVKGKLVPANLTLLTRLCGTDFLPDFSSSILLLEEVGELPRKIDFSFLQLHLAGVFAKCSGILLGQYTNCGTAKELERIFMRAAEMVKCPVYGFIPFGHGKCSRSFVCGEPCMIGEDGFFRLLR